MKTKVIHVGGDLYGLCRPRGERARDCRRCLACPGKHREQHHGRVFDKSRVTDEQLAYSMRGVNYQVIEDNRIKTVRQELKALNVQRRNLLISMVFAVVLIVIAMGRVVGLEIPLDPLPPCLVQLVPCLSIMYGGKRFYRKDILTPFTKSLLVD